MTTLTHFLPRHFQPINTSHAPYHSDAFSQPRHSSPYASTSDASSSDSPAFMSSSSSPVSPPPPHKRHLSLPIPTVAALLPSPPSLARESSTTPPPPAPSRPLFINTSITHAPNPLSTLQSTYTPDSSPSTSPLTATSLPSVSTIHLNDASQPTTPTQPDLPSYPQYQVDVDDVSTMTLSHPKSPVPSIRRVAEVTPPTSPYTSTIPFPPPALSSPSLSSALAQSFSSEPSLPELLASISMVLHVQLIKDQSSPLRSQLRLPDFREQSPPSPSHSPSTCPSVRSIYQFLLHVFQRGKFSSELGLVSLVYVHRVMASTGVALTPHNYRPLFMAALCLAQKMWDDTPLLNGDFRLLYPQLVQSSNKSIFLAVFNRLEAQLCEALHFNLVVTSDTYQLYLTELQAIWTEYEQGGHHHQHSPVTTPAVAVHRSSSPLKDPHPSKLSAHRHHPYRVKAHSKPVDWMEVKVDEGELAGGWDPSVLTIPVGQVAKV